MAMAAMVASTARLGATSLSLTTRSPVQLQTSFKGEKMGAGAGPFSVAKSPIRVAPQELQIQAMKKIKGKVVCAASNKTVSVEVTRIHTHPKYKKIIKSSKNYHAHDEENRCQVGDTVLLVGCAPISKSKKFRVSEIIPKPVVVQDEDVEIPAFLTKLVPAKRTLAKRTPAKRTRA